MRLYMNKLHGLFFLIFWCNQLLAIDTEKYDSGRLIYRNWSYGYHVLFPKYVHHCTTDEPAPDHGVIFLLDESASLNCGEYTKNPFITPTIRINAEYNIAFESNTPKDYAKHLVSLHSKISHALPWISVYLDTLSAVRLTLKQERNISWISEIVAAQNSDGNGDKSSWVNISIILYTTQKRYSKDVQLFNTILNGFKLTSGK